MMVSIGTPELAEIVHQNIFNFGKVSFGHLHTTFELYKVSFDDDTTHIGFEANRIQLTSDISFLENFSWH